MPVAILQNVVKDKKPQLMFWKAIGLTLMVLQKQYLQDNQVTCEFCLMLTWFENFIICNVTGATTFVITDKKFYVPVVTLSDQNNAKLLQQLKPGFKGKANCNEYQPNVQTQVYSKYLLRLFD